MCGKGAGLAAGAGGDAAAGVAELTRAALPAVQICNCDCLPIVPLDVAQQMCQLGAAQAHSEDEAMSPHMLCTRGSMDSERSLL